MTSEHRRVCVTGIATLNPLGNDIATAWEAVQAGRSGIGPITLFDATGFETRIAGEVRNLLQPERLTELERLARIDEQVLRHLTVVDPVDPAEHGVQRMDHDKDEEE